MLSDTSYLYNYFLTSVEILKPRGVQSLLSLIRKVWVWGSGSVITVLVPLEFITMLGCNVRAPPIDLLVTSHGSDQKKFSEPVILLSSSSASATLQRDSS